MLSDTTDQVALEVEEWPRDDGSTIVLDLSNGHPEGPRISQLGYRFVSVLDQRVGTLQKCLQHWTGMSVRTEIIHDAIEEYMGV